MLTPALSKQIDAMSRRADAMQTAAQILFSQTQRQRQEIEDLKMQLELQNCSTGNGRIFAAPPLAALLGGRG